MLRSLLFVPDHCNRQCAIWHGLYILTCLSLRISPPPHTHTLSVCRINSAIFSLVSASHCFLQGSKNHPTIQTLPKDLTRMLSPSAWRRTPLREGSLFPPCDAQHLHFHCQASILVIVLEGRQGSRFDSQSWCRAFCHSLELPDSNRDDKIPPTPHTLLSVPGAKAQAGAAARKT